MATALIVVTEHGYWGEECVEPLTRLDETGVDVTVATPSGAPPEVDESSVDPDEVGAETAEQVREVHETDPRLNDPEIVATQSATDYDTVVFPGGHGTVWDINQDLHARRLLRNAVAGEDGFAVVICHAVGLLGFTRGSDGSFLVEGRDVTGFPNAWEVEIVDENDVMPDGRKLPYYVEDEVSAAGGDWNAELDQPTSVAIDGDLMTVRGPASSAEGAEAILDRLGVEVPAGD